MHLASRPPGPLETLQTPSFTVEWGEAKGEREGTGLLGDGVCWGEKDQAFG